MSGIFLRIRELPQDIEIRNGRVNVRVEARKALLLTWSVSQDRVRPIFRQSTTFVDEFLKWLAAREIFARNSVIFETSRNLRKLPSLYYSLSLLIRQPILWQPPKHPTREQTRQSLVKSPMLIQQESGTITNRMQLFKPILSRSDLGINLGITQCHRYPICHHKHVCVPKKMHI